MKDKDIFDLKNIDDLSEDIKKQLNPNGFSDKTQKLFDLFKIKEILSIDEMLVGLFRLHGISVNKTWISSTLYNISRKGLVERLGSGKYRLVGE